MISVQQLQFSWSRGEFALNVANLRVPAGSAVVLTGPSGSGKSTLLNLIAGNLVAQSGRIQVGRTHVDQLNDQQRRAYRLTQVGQVFQSFELIDYLPVLENVLLPARISPALKLSPELRQRAEQLLARVGLLECAGRSVTQLSQGERQRVAICRALLPQPPLLLADEPTGNLDPATTRTILDVLLEQVRDHGSTLLMVTHDHTLLSCFDQTIDFDSLQTAAGAESC